MRGRPSSVPPDPLEWRPQNPVQARKPPTVRDPILEPLWSGQRVMMHFEAALDDPRAGGVGRSIAPRVRLIDPDGVELTLEDPELAREIAMSVAAEDAVMDGVLTGQATRGGVGAAIVTESNVSIMAMMVSPDPGVEVVRKRMPGEDEDPPVAFVALDLLRLDGESLLDLPLLERKRLLEAVVVESDRVRVTVHTRPPVDMWVASWKSTGFKGGMLKGANSRYVPGGLTDEWRTVTRVAGRR